MYPGLSYEQISLWHVLYIIIDLGQSIVTIAKMSSFENVID